MTARRSLFKSLLSASVLLCAADEQCDAADLLLSGRLNPLVLAWVNEGGLIVDPYARHPKVIAFRQAQTTGSAEMSWSMGPHGVFILRRSLSRSHLALQDLAGKVLVEWDPIMAHHSPPGIGLDGSTVAVLGSAKGRQGIWHFLPDGSIRLVVPLEGRVGQKPPVCWTSQGLHVVEHEDRILSCDPKTGNCLAIVRGKAPTCSPDGRRVAYRDGDGYSVIIDLVDPSHPVFRSSRRVGYDGAFWSPDGSLLFVNEDTKTSSALVAYRLSDRRRQHIADTGMKSIRWLACLQSSQLPR